MIAVMSSKWVADSLYPDGIYMAWISLVRIKVSFASGLRFLTRLNKHDYPFLPMTEFRDKGDTAADHMRPIADIKVIDGRSSTLQELGEGQRFYRSCNGVLSTLEQNTT